MKERVRSGGASRQVKVSGRSAAQTHIWRLPSGKHLAEFALEAGFLAPLMFAPSGVGRQQENAVKKADQQ